MNASPKGGGKVAGNCETILVSIGEIAVGSIEIMQTGDRVLHVDIPDEEADRARSQRVTRNLLTQASLRLAQYSPERFVSMSEEEAAFTIAAAILLELKEMGVVRDASKKKRVIRCSAADMSDFVMICWVVHPAALVLPKCVPHTRAEIVLKVNETSFKDGHSPIPGGWVDEDDGA